MSLKRTQVLIPRLAGPCAGPDGGDVRRLLGTLIGPVLACGLATQVLSAQAQGTLAGTVVDALGARLPGAAVMLLRDGQSVQETLP